MKLPKRRTRIASGAQPTIALLTDFGLSDHYVGTMKGVIRSINASAVVVDITHGVQPQQVKQAGYLLWAAYRFFPNNTIFVSVVDPGVGSKRRLVTIRTQKYIFLAPDNMLLDFVLSEEKVVEAVEVKLENSPYILSSVSSTFHGRDVFAPVAAYLSNGIALKEMGTRVSVHPAMSPFVEIDDPAATKAEILHIDRFGNLITNIRIVSREESYQRARGLRINGRAVRQWTKTYAAAPMNTPCLIVGSSGLVEVVVQNGNAASIIQARVSNTVEILPS